MQNDVQKQDALHRTNRILMIVISLLLALVLITTCVLSGVYARYTTSKTVGTTIKFKKRDISVNIEVSNALSSYVTSGDQGNAFDIVISGLQLSPGDKFEDALKMTVNGSPSSLSNFVIDFKINYNNGSFVIHENTFEGKTAGTPCMPIGFMVGTYDAEGNYTVGTYDSNGNLIRYASEPYSYKDGATIAQDIENAIVGITALGFTHSTENSNNEPAYEIAAIKQCPAAQKVTFGENVSALGFGFEWPLEHGESETLTLNDQLGTWFSNQDHTFDIILTIGIE